MEVVCSALDFLPRVEACKELPLGSKYPCNEFLRVCRDMQGHIGFKGPSIQILGF